MPVVCVCWWAKDRYTSSLTVRSYVRTQHSHYILFINRCFRSDRSAADHWFVPYFHQWSIREKIIWRTVSRNLVSLWTLSNTWTLIWLSFASCYWWMVLHCFWKLIDRSISNENSFCSMKSILWWYSSQETSVSLCCHLLTWQSVHCSTHTDFESFKNPKSRRNLTLSDSVEFITFISFSFCLIDSSYRTMFRSALRIGWIGLSRGQQQQKNSKAAVMVIQSMYSVHVQFIVNYGIYYLAHRSLDSRNSTWIECFRIGQLQIVETTSWCCHCRIHLDRWFWRECSKQRTNVEFRSKKRTGTASLELWW